MRRALSGTLAVFLLLMGIAVVLATFKALFESHAMLWTWLATMPFLFLFMLGVTNMVFSLVRRWENTDG